ncbi:quinoprotein dehydrogenase-associated SoxYZ-like carrier [Pseudaquabacterium pictum]|uniref:Quinoprotein dehydrogenase-associated SoxYZ-like carrier n=1 Tax=Pseudaquabacterium pictum TaxID=2315236 RepID=A0A480ANG9_9BURK|nr:quinoprotein dehydrogenase-associated SoxYZ-like carrier [Rubrivivax pictus]GCL63199.1 quinoprotein dehydrogenase-associated SoxYZ-like carrier [Rubrivivax pictus]
MQRRHLLLAAGALPWSAALQAAAPRDQFDGDPFQSFQWPELKKEFLGPRARTVFDARVKVQGPAFAEDPMNVPITVATDLPGVQRIVVLVDRNPIRKVLELQPLAAQPAVSFRFKLEQASPVRALVQTADGLWHVGGTWVDSAGGGCTVSGATRADGSWSQTLGQVSGRVFAGLASTPGGDAAARLRVRIMHPMDTGLVGGIPAFFVSRLSVRDAVDRELLRIQTFEPVSENPVFSFDFAKAPPGPLRIVGVDNNGNRIDSKVD